MNILHAVHKVGQTATNLFFENSASDVTVPQALILQALKATPGISQTAIVAATGIDRSTTAEMIKRLQKKGWLERKRNPDDSRAYIVKLTQEGNDILKNAKASAAKAEKALLEKCPGVRSLLNGH